MASEENLFKLSVFYLFKDYKAENYGGWTVYIILTFYYEISTNTLDELERTIKRLDPLL